MTLSSSKDSKTSTSDSGNNGLIGRIVENWLTNASERSYQIPFCQLLAAEGEELLYIASHGAFEKGKDVVTRMPDGSVRAYQMKSGDTNLADWRELHGQINDLVELPVNLPQCTLPASHAPYFVTSGKVNDAVLDTINTANLGWRQRGFAHTLNIIDKSQLVHRFVAIHGAYLPQEASDFQHLLTLLLGDGNGPLDKAKFSSFLQQLIFSDENTSATKVLRSLSSAVLLTSYIVGTAEKQSNYWFLFEAWTVMASYVLASATKFNLTKKLWEPSFNLAMLAANRALDDLVQECKNRQHFTEGHPMGDGYLYGSRQLILAGMLSAWALRRRIENIESDQDVQKIILGRVRQSFVWGESAAPFLLLTALELEQQCKQPLAERLIIDYMQGLLLCHREGSRGLPDSFITIEDSIKFMYLLGDQHFESFQGFSHTCQTVVDYLARRWRRGALSSVWEFITHLSLDSSVPQLPWEWFYWRSDSAVLESSLPGQPQSWSVLVKDATNRDISSLPPLLTSNPVFSLFFLLVFPHRLTPRTFAAVDRFL